MKTISEKIKEGRENSKIEHLFVDLWKKITSANFKIYVFLGGRGIGKTYSTLRGALEENRKIMYIRRTDKEIKNCTKAFNNPFKRLNKDYDLDIRIEKNDDMYLIYDYLTGKEVGIAASLSTFGKLRGVDFEDIEVVIVEEFICTSKVDRYKDDGYDFLNMVETIVRNDDIIANRFIKFILLANSNRIESGILLELKLLEVIRKMKVKNKKISTVEKSQIYIELLEDVPITELKKKTFLYNIKEDSEFNDMAVNNNFLDNEFSVVKNGLNLKGYVPLGQFNGITILASNNDNSIYLTSKKYKCVDFSDNVDRFRYKFKPLINHHMINSTVYTDSYDNFIEIKKAIY